MSESGIVRARSLSGWECANCTFLNDRVSETCSVCGNPRPSGDARDHDVDDDDEKEDDDEHTEHQLAPTEYEQFEFALNVIVGHTPNHEAAIVILKSLKRITERVSEIDGRYRSLNTQNNAVQTKFGFLSPVF